MDAGLEVGQDLSLKSTPVLRKGGGAISGIGEKFSANPATGTVSLSIPLPISPGRALAPELSLNYDSGAGSGPFGLGWTCQPASVSRNTDKGLPSYEDGRDVFSLSGTDDLVPELDANGSRIEFPVKEDENNWRIGRFRPRSEGAFARIEHWVNQSNGSSHWRVWSGGNTVSVFGLSEDECLCDPDNPAHIYRWLLSRTYDAHGNLTIYRYKREDDAGVNFSHPSEMHRRGQKSANLYLKEVLYGNREPFQGNHLLDDAFCFSLVFDYGEHAGDLPQKAEQSEWAHRDDPFSNYRSGFDIRTRRLCSRVIGFHHFPEKQLHHQPVQALNLLHRTLPGGQARLEEVVQRSFMKVNSGGFVHEDMPKLVLRYKDIERDSRPAREITTSDGQRDFLHATQANWALEDLLSEALPGLVEQVGGTISFRRNTGGVLEISKAFTKVPAAMSVGATYSASLGGNSVRSHDLRSSYVSGRHDLDMGGSAVAFHPYRAVPSEGVNSPQMRQLDIDGDGLGDILSSDGEHLVWYRSRGTKGHAGPERITVPLGERSKPRFVFSDNGQAIFLADMSGDGVSDVVRITASSLIYWPNIGHGRFAPPVMMADCPVFDHSDQFDAARMRLVDLDGNGLSDIIHLGPSQIRLWRNDNGNRFSPAEEMPAPYRFGKPPETAQFIDIEGTGMPCLVWSDTLTGSGKTRLRYKPINAPEKPHLLTRVESPLGGVTEYFYKPSTYYYLADREAGLTWATRLHFPVHCLSEVRVSDKITGYAAATTYSYHHGCYDDFDREFRGFGRVDTVETELETHGESDPVAKLLHQPPILTKTWYHTGAAAHLRDLAQAYEAEYFHHSALAIPALLPILPDDLNGEEHRQAIRAAKGTTLRSEVYSLDGSEKEAIPYSVTVSRTCIVKRQNALPDLDADTDRGRWAVFQVLPRDMISWTLDRVPEQARINESVVLSYDAFGNPLLSAAIGHSRANIPADVPAAAAAEQNRTHCVVNRISYTDVRESGSAIVPSVLLGSANARFIPVPCEAESWELRGLSGRIPGLNEDVLALFDNAELIPLQSATSAQHGKRLLSASRTYFADDNLTAGLELGRLGKTGIPYRSAVLAFTDDHLSAIYGQRIGTDVAARRNAMLEALYENCADRTGLADPDMWWVMSGLQGYGDAPDETFHMSKSTTDLLGRTSHVKHDSDNLLTVSVRNVLDQEIRAINDYRILSPVLVRDANNNWSAAAHDAFGRPVATAAMGKVGGIDQPTGYETCEGSNLDKPSAIFTYDVNAFMARSEPARASSVVFEHDYFSGGDRSLTQASHEHTGGLGQVIMTKVQAAPGEALAEQPDGTVAIVDTGDELRWIGNGRTVFNNKGQPLKQYEPYFSVTTGYETNPILVEQGPSATMLYDAAGRALGVLNADMSWSKTVNTPWKAESWDVGDTCLIESLGDDPDMAGRLGASAGEIFSESWIATRRKPDAGDDEARSADQSEVYANTPSVAHADSLGRPIVSIADLGGGHRIETRSELDIEGNLLAAIDSSGRHVEESLYSMLPPPEEDKPRPALWRNSMDAGERVTFMDALGRMVKSWDSRGHVSRMIYDDLDRPVASFVSKDDNPELCTSRMEYGDGLPDAANKNMIGQVWRSWDQSGMAETLAVDFRGNVTRSAHRFASDYDGDINWPDDEQHRLERLEEEVFVVAVEFDALGRITRSVSPSPGLPLSKDEEPDLSKLTISVPGYDRGGVLGSMEVTVRDTGTVNHVGGITYEATGQRKSVTYGNGVTTQYAYDPKTYRLTHLVSKTPDGTAIQDLAYTYDIVGNIVSIRDSTVPVIHHNNQRVEALSIYVYDPLYRLRKATGREHAHRKGATGSQTGSELDTTLAGVRELRNYRQIFDFDDYNNLTRVRHIADGGSWTRHYRHDTQSNRLTKSWTGRETDEPANDNFTHDAHGSMTAMPETSELVWDFADRLRSVDKGNGPEAWYVYDGSGQRVRKVCHHTGTNVRSERLYFGGFEIYREFGGAGSAKRMERETLHVSDDTGRIALVEALTHQNGAPVDPHEPNVRYQLGNHFGSVSLELDESGVEISREEYHPYGTSAFCSGASGARYPPKRYRYTGKERDEETGFTYHGARYYAPWLGRWTASDPIGIGDGLNVYAYVGGRPVGSIDPEGTSEGWIVGLHRTSAPSSRLILADGWRFTSFNRNLWFGNGVYFSSTPNIASTTATGAGRIGDILIAQRIRVGDIVDLHGPQMRFFLTAEGRAALRSGNFDNSSGRYGFDYRQVQQRNDLLDNAPTRRPGSWRTADYEALGRPRGPRKTLYLPCCGSEMSSSEIGFIAGWRNWPTRRMSS